MLGKTRSSPPLAPAPFPLRQPDRQGQDPRRRRAALMADVIITGEGEMPARTQRRQAGSDALPPASGPASARLLPAICALPASAASPRRCPQAEGSDKVRMAGAAPGEAGGDARSRAAFPSPLGEKESFAVIVEEFIIIFFFFGCFQKLQQYIHKYLITTFNK